MSGYKRVNFYELCRLCASNQQKDKTHIFHEEGKKIQLQTKIQACLSLTVCENDFLPKVICSKCLRSLEVCYTFRQECVTSEGMLSSYFKNFRYTEDFKKSGKVYIKDTTKNQPETPLSPTFGESKPDLPFYTAQTPKDEPHAPENYPPKSNPKTGEQLSNVVVNAANGEVLNIAQLVDFDFGGAKKRKKKEPEPIIKIDLTHFDDKAQYQPTKAKYALKIEENRLNSVIFSNLDFQGGAGQFNYYNNAGGGPSAASTVNLGHLSEAQASTAKSHVCEICQKSFKRREHLYQHVKLHTGFRPYSCENCAKSFMRKEHLLRHQTSHSGQKNYTCSVCEKSFSRNDNLLKHKKTHEKQASYTCEVCQKQFVMKHYYLAHKLSHDNGAGGGGGALVGVNMWNVLKT